MIRLNKLLLNNGDNRAFDARIEPEEKQRLFLTACKNKIRDHLHLGIRQASRTVLGMDHQVEPRFRTQGSWSYKTCIQRAHPLQEMDWDFGVYLPVTVFQDQEQTPTVAAKAYFSLVESLLTSLCRQEGWTLNTGNIKCIRVQVASWAHIDVPLYAAPETEFQFIREHAAVLAKASASRRDVLYLNESVIAGELTEPEWEDLKGIHLAMRDGQWKKSDPEAVSRWYNGRVLALAPVGEQMRRVSRYSKGWRDFWWPGEDGPSSVGLMIAVARDFSSSNPRRDDLALESSANHLAAALLRPLHERAIDQGAEDFFSKLDEDQRRIASHRATHLAATIAEARQLAYFQRNQAIEMLQSVLGQRVPNMLDWVEPETSEAEVRQTPAARVPPPIIKSTKAG